MNIKQAGYYAAVDPLSLILPDAVYVKVVEGLHPHVPLVDTLKRAAKGLTAAERKAALVKVNAMAEMVNCVKEVLEKPVE